MSAIVVVSDTSPIRALDHLTLLHLLPTLYQTVYAPPAVVHELTRAGCAGRAAPYLTVKSPNDPRVAAGFQPRIHQGEAEAIALALELRPEFLLIDDSDARQVAEQLGLSVVGVLGVLVQAKDAGHVTSVMPLVEKLERGISFWVSNPLRDRVRHLARE